MSIFYNLCVTSSVDRIFELLAVFGIMNTATVNTLVCDFFVSLSTHFSWVYA